VARLVLICGLPGAGKTTLALHLARETGARRLGTDEAMSLLGVDYFDDPGREQVEEQLWGVARELLAAGVDVILESGFWARAEREEKCRGARAVGATVDLRYLDVPLDELWERVEQRNRRGGWGGATISEQQFLSWTPLFEAPCEEELRAARGGAGVRQP
jgi:predicted kinase